MKDNKKNRNRHERKIYLQISIKRVGSIEEKLRKKTHTKTHFIFSPLRHVISLLRSFECNLLSYKSATFSVKQTSSKSIINISSYSLCVSSKHHSEMLFNEFRTFMCVNMRFHFHFPHTNSRHISSDKYSPFDYSFIFVSIG